MNRRLRNVARSIGITILLLSGSYSSAHAQDGIPMREKRREIIPLEQLKIFLEAPKRIQDMQPERVLDVLGVVQGDTVADVGAGTGFFSFPMAGRVGAGGKVYAVEIEDALLDFIREKIAAQGVANIIPTKSSESSPNLPPGCCDKILVANTYIYFDQPVAFMKNLLPALQPGGRVAIIEVDTEQADSAKRPLLRTRGRSAGEVIIEMKSAGFVLRESHNFLGSRFFLVFGPEE